MLVDGCEGSKSNGLSLEKPQPGDAAAAAAGGGAAADDDVPVVIAS